VVAELVRANELQSKANNSKRTSRELAAELRKAARSGALVSEHYNSRMAEVEAVVIENNVTTLSWCHKVTDKSVSFDELMAQS
jgi:trigger factor